MPSKEDKGGAMKSVLIVDDEAGTRESLRMILKNDYEVLLEKNAEEEFQMVKELPRDSIIHRALSTQAVAKEVKYLREEADKGFGFEHIIGKSKAMDEIFKMVRQIADSKSTVLIMGESGTGKELISRSIHFSSNRRSCPFITINCAAIPETLIESELFGHEKGAFTNAIERKLGRFEIAQRGTLFLDEIGELSLTTQAKILRFLEEKEFNRDGGSKTIKVDVRLIAATNKDLNQLIRKGMFREDLYYGTNVVPMVLPPLREKREDIPLLIDHFIAT